MPRVVGSNLKTLKRPRFYTPDPQPRVLRAQQKSDEVNLSQATLKSLLRVDVADKTDTEWTNEFDTLQQRYPTYTKQEIEQLIGRKQRTETKMMTFGETGQVLDTRLKLIESALQQGRVDNSYQTVVMFNNISNLLESDFKQIEARNQLPLLSTALVSLDIPDDPIETTTRAIFDSTQFMLEKGNVLAYILAKAPPNTVGYVIDTTSLKRQLSGKLMTIGEMIQALDTGDRLLDLNQSPPQIVDKDVYVQGGFWAP